MRPLRSTASRFVCRGLKTSNLRDIIELVSDFVNACGRECLSSPLLGLNRISPSQTASCASLDITFPLFFAYQLLIKVWFWRFSGLLFYRSS